MKKNNRKNDAGPSHISDSLRSLFQQNLKVPEFGAELKIWEYWEKAVGIEIARHATLKSFKNGVLFVDTKHSAWATELQFRSHQIRKKLNNALGQEIVKEIQFRLGR